MAANSSEERGGKAFDGSARMASIVALIGAASSRDARGLAKVLGESGGLLAAPNIESALRIAVEGVDVASLEALLPFVDGEQAARGLCLLGQGKPPAEDGGRAMAAAADLLIPLADLESMAWAGMTPLMRACQNGAAGLAARLAGVCEVDSICPGMGRSALAYAAGAGSEAAVASMLAAGASARMSDRQGRTPLMAYSGRAGSEFAALVQAGEPLAKDKHGRSAVEHCLDKARLDLAEAMVGAANACDRKDLLSRWEAWIKEPSIAAGFRADAEARLAKVRVLIEAREIEAACEAPSQADAPRLRM